MLHEGYVSGTETDVLGEKRQGAYSCCLAPDSEVAKADISGGG